MMKMNEEIVKDNFNKVQEECSSEEEFETDICN